MPSKNVSYSCCICGTVYKDLVAAEECEKHIKFQPVLINRNMWKRKKIENRIIHYQSLCILQTIHQQDIIASKLRFPRGGS